jgi:hypothetical protein
MRRWLRLSLGGGTSRAVEKDRTMANLELWLSSGEKLQIRVDNPETELTSLKTRDGRFSGEFVDLTGPALGIVRTDEIVAVVIR